MLTESAEMKHYRRVFINAFRNVTYNFVGRTGETENSFFFF